MTKEELLAIQGGATTWTSSFINALVNGFEFLYTLGKSVGNSFAQWLGVGC